MIPFREPRCLERAIRGGRLTGSMFLLVRKEKHRDLCWFTILRLGGKLKAALVESKETQVLMLGVGNVQRIQRDSNRAKIVSKSACDQSTSALTL